MRQTAGTVYHQLLAQGFAPEQLHAEEDSHPGTRRIGLAVAAQEGTETPLIGVAYGGDYRTEEEEGIADISSGLKAGEHRDRVLSGEVEGHRYLGVHSARGLTHGRHQKGINERAAIALRRSSNEAKGQYWRDQWLTVAQLRDGLRDAGITGPLPRTKAALQDMYATQVRKTHALANVGEFHDGKTLILFPARPALTATLRILAEAGKHLQMGGSHSPFGRGATLFDERDLTGETVESARAREDYLRRMNQKAEATRDALRAKGLLFALRPGKRENGQDYFLLNYTPRGHKQVHGWFTLEELLNKSASGDWT